ncbi:26S protease regulatory subunit 7 [Fasciola hepatica]|uniref:26S protease regulatory subunit 7 n=1 Tax=Fasciola hepatica TaxID=6192 RepID=A0A4E0QZS2_FASHE|nr:26S protease regulatory subunit 7 [Fasciola hepatica]
MVLPADIEERKRARVDRTQSQLNLHSPSKLILSDKMTQVEYEPNVTCTDVGGCEDLFERSPEIIGKLCLHPKLFVSLRNEPPKDILLFGASGNGGKRRARAVVNRIEACLIRGISSELVQKYVDERTFTVRK